MLMELWELLEVRPGITALIGGGGKTSAMYTLARELARRGTVICTTTTHILPPEHMPVLTGEDGIPAALASRLTGRRRGVICFCAGVQGATVAVNITMQITEQLTFYLALSVPAISLAGLTAALVTALAEAVHREITRRTEERLLAQRFELAQSSNEALRRQNEQVMMLRHDMIKHFRVLRQMVTDEKTAAYFG